MSDPLKLPNGVVVYQPTYLHPSAVIGARTRIGAFCDVSTGVEIGEDCNIQAHVTIPQRTKIGNRVFLGPQVCILNDKYPPNHELQSVMILDDVMVGGGAIILPGLTLGRGAIIGAGSLVTRTVLPDTVVWGSPARKKAARADYELRREAMIRVAG